MKKIFTTILDVFGDDVPPLKSKEVENEEIISAYHLVKRAVPDYSEPNYDLAEKVFLEFNDFNLKNLDLNLMYLGFIPQSLLPYPKNYIKCAYYIFLEQAKKNKDLKMFNLIQEVGTGLFFNYPNYDKYQENLKLKAMYDDVLFKNGNPLNGRIPRDEFKKLYGTYQISKEEYDNSPSSIDATNEKLIHDFGFLPEIEKDVDMSGMIKSNKMDWLETNNFKKLKSIGNIRLLLASGIFLGNLEHRFDLLIVTGEPRHEQIIVTIQAIEAEIGKELSYAVFDTADFLYRANMYDKLIGDILDSEYIKIIDRGILCQLSGRFSESTNQSEDNEDTSSKRTLLALVKTRGNTTEKTIREGGEVLTKQGDGAEKEFINTTGMNSDEAIRVITEKLSEYKILS